LLQAKLDIDVRDRHGGMFLEEIDDPLPEFVVYRAEDEHSFAEIGIIELNFT
jgi:hypothetical protein